MCNWFNSGKYVALSMSYFDKKYIFKRHEYNIGKNCGIELSERFCNAMYCEEFVSVLVNSIKVVEKQRLWVHFSI